MFPRKRSGRLPEPLSRGEIARLLDATPNTKHRVLLMTTYGGGLRVSELVHLKPQDIHSERMLIRVNQGKGRKDRYTLLSPRLLEELRAYWRAVSAAGVAVSEGRRQRLPPAGGHGPEDVLPGQGAGGHPAWPRHPFVAAFLRHALDGSGRALAGDPAADGAQPA